MKIRIKATGEIVHAERSAAIEILQKSGLVEYVHEEPPKPKPTVQWKLITEPDGELIIDVFCGTCMSRSQVANPTSKYQFRCSCGVTPLPTEYFEHYLKKLPEQKRKLYETRS